MPKPAVARSGGLAAAFGSLKSIGLEGLFGFKEARDGTDSGDIWRVQVGMVYSLFD